jgi:hypothetical protein
MLEKQVAGMGCSLVVEYLLSMSEALEFNPQHCLINKYVSGKK